MSRTHEVRDEAEGGQASISSLRDFIVALALCMHLDLHADVVDQNGKRNSDGAQREHDNWKSIKG